MKERTQKESGRVWEKKEEWHRKNSACESVLVGACVCACVVEWVSKRETERIRGFRFNFIVKSFYEGWGVLMWLSKAMFLVMFDNCNDNNCNDNNNNDNDGNDGNDGNDDNDNDGHGSSRCGWSRLNRRLKRNSATRGKKSFETAKSFNWQHRLVINF